MRMVKLLSNAVFLSTPSARRATLLTAALEKASDISIHALREEGDVLTAIDRMSDCGFLSTPSARRATLSSTMPSCTGWIFLSTPSARRATEIKDDAPENLAISIHALREEGDVSRCNHPTGWMGISIHALREEGDSVAST